MASWINVPIFFQSPVKGVGLLIPISLPLETVVVAIFEVGWVGFRNVEKGVKGWKGNGGWNGGSWLTGFRSEV